MPKNQARDVFERYLMDACQYIVSAYLKTEFAGKSIDLQDLDAKQALRYFYEASVVCVGSSTARESRMKFRAGELNGGMKDDIVGYFRRVCTLQKGWLENLGR